MELEKYRKIFIQESSRYLEELDAILLEVEKNLQDQVLWSEIHGKIHSVKGMARALSMMELSAFCHAMESWCKLFQEGAKKPNEAVVQLFFDGIDLLKAFVAGKGEITEPEDLERLKGLSEKFTKDPEELVAPAESKVRPTSTPGKIDRIRVDYALIESLLARSQEIMLLEKTLPPLSRDQISAGSKTGWITIFPCSKDSIFSWPSSGLCPSRILGSFLKKRFETWPNPTAVK